jgi:2-oxoglutarate ferredoxin oxidoreductase subunit alpha
MTKPFEYPNTPLDRGKVLWEDDLEERKGVWGRYKDSDNDGVPYRTVPGNSHPTAAWFSRGTGHDENARYSEDADTWEKNLLRLTKKYKTARTFVPKPEINTCKDARFGIITFGSSTPAVQEARKLLQVQEGIKTNLLRLRALPFTKEVQTFVRKNERIYIVEANRDGQLFQILCASMPDQAPKFRSACHSDGLPLTAKWVRTSILDQEKNE